MGRSQRRWCGRIVLGMIVVVMGCGSGTETHPDTGYGADQAVPAAIACTAWCQRSTDCLVDLCDEDKNTTEFEGLEYPATEGCESSCMDAQLQGITQAEWSCLFQQTCREVYQDDACHIQARYSCTTS